MADGTAPQHTAHDTTRCGKDKLPACFWYDTGCLEKIRGGVHRYQDDLTILLLFLKNKEDRQKNKLHELFKNIFDMVCTIKGAHGSVVVKALCYKLEGRGFDFRWGEFLNLPNPSGRTRPWGSLKPLTEMSTRNRKIMLLRSKVWLVRRDDNLTAIYEPIV
jgi:hypothetical protein